MARPPKEPATPEAEAGEVKSPKARAKRMSGLALKALESILLGQGSDAAKIAAAREILDRAYGKARANEKKSAGKKVTVVIRRLGDGGRVIPFKRQSDE